MRGGVYLRFSPAQGRSDGTVPVPLRDRGGPSPRPYGLFLHRLRCSAPRTAPGSKNPYVPVLRRRMCRAAALLLFAPASAAGGRPNRGPLRRGERAKEKSVRIARRRRASSWNVHGRASHEPRSALANSQGRMPRECAFGGGLLLLTSLGQTREVSRSPQGSGSSAFGK